MANKLSARGVATLSNPGKYGDGNGLMLIVRASGAKSWQQRLSIHGRRCDMGLGNYPDVSLSDARRIAEENKRVAASGKDPRAIKQAAIQQAKEEAQAGLTWAEACVAVHDLNKDSWRNAKHTDQFISSLQTYTPKMAKVPMEDIEQRQIFDALSQIWLKKPETARRVFQRIRKVLMWAKAQGAFTGSPHDTMDAVKGALPSQKVVSKVKHHKAVPFEDVAAFVETLRGTMARPTSKLALEFIILCASRSGEVRFAEWSEIDFEARTWTIPEERMKAAKEHVVPLTDRAIEILHEAKLYTDGSHLIFPGSRYGKPLSDATSRKLLQENGHPDCTVHGFRSSFRDWCNEVARAAHEVAEMSLAHQVGNAVERAYSRSNLLERRRELMDAWAHYVEPDKPGNVIALSA
jgi:integrase